MRKLRDKAVQEQQEANKKVQESGEVLKKVCRSIDLTHRQCITWTGLLLDGDQLQQDGWHVEGHM